MVDFSAFYTVRQAAAALGVSTQRVYQIIERGDLTPTRSPHGILLLRLQVKALKDERIHPHTPPEAEEIEAEDPPEA